MDKKSDLEHALDALSILREIDLALCPMEPTEHMCKMGATIGNIDPETAKKVYKIMLLCSSELDRGKDTNLH